MTNAHNPVTQQPMRAPRGATLSCKGWAQEAVLRLLLNSLDPDVAERPQELVISGAAGKAAADRESLQAIVEGLRALAGDETLRVESGRLAGVSRTTAGSPRVAASSKSGEKFGDWLYAGTQTELPVPYEIYGEAARQHFGGTLAGKLVVGGGMGGAGGAQALAAALHGAAFLGIDIDAERIKRRVKSGYCEVMVNNPDEALRMLKNAVRQGQSASIGLIGNCAELFPEFARRGVVPDVLTDYTTAPPAPSQLQGMRDLQKLGTLVIDSAKAQGYLQPLYDDGWRLATWMALSGEPADIARLDQLALEMLRDDERLRHWLALAGKHVRFQGLPARVGWLRQSDLGRLAATANDLVAQGELRAPVLFGWQSAPAEKIADSRESGACWTWAGGAETIVLSPNECPAQAAVADGTAGAADRLSQWAGA
jgi:urocanate hydratase